MSSPPPPSNSSKGVPPWTAFSSRTRATDDALVEGLRSDVLQAFDWVAEVERTAPVRLENFSSRGSYSWIDAHKPTILVPGSPRAWRDRALPFRVSQDWGFNVFDPSGFFMGTMSKLLPLFRAVDVMEEDARAETRTEWGALDFVLDRSSMRKLLRWVRFADPTTPPTGALPPPFRLDLQLGGEKTVLVDRWDTRTFETMPLGFRRNFDEATTAPTTSAQSTKYHHRIVQYDLESLRLMVRFEVDAFTRDDDDPTDLFANLSLSSSSTPPITTPATTDTSTAIAVVRGGERIPHTSLVEITTRSRKAAGYKWYETYSQLFLSQTPHFYLGMHDHGTFFEIEKHELASPKFDRYEKDERMQRSLRQLVRLLEAVQDLVKQHGKEGRLSLVCRKGKLELLERTAGHDGAGRLPDSVLARFDRSASRP
ncbi:hypothetical protein FKP32DRAFT_1566676 [Trametes sanguinea]|nr:hypothetical protein FKP32DRAFT_1566676 [Trametes sanguinea]